MHAAPLFRPPVESPPATLRRSVCSSLKRFVRTEDGTTSVEYAVMLALILATIFGTVGAIGGTTGGLFTDAETKLEAAGF